MLLRRKFIGTAAGLTIATRFGNRLLAGEPGVPIPIPHATPGPFGPLHFFFPGPVEGVNANTGHDPSTIYNFNGFIGQADLKLSGTGTDTTTNVTAPYTFHTDMRFMLGEFVGTDGEVHRGAFAFIWLDSLTGSLGPHSYDPGVAANGLFWTTPIPVSSVDVHLGAGKATLHVEDVLVTDQFTVPNSLNPAHPLGHAPAVINSMTINWGDAKRKVEFSDPINMFAGLFVEGSAQIDVTATTPPTLTHHGFKFVSTPGTTITNFAQVGHDHNGSFFPG